VFDGKKREKFVFVFTEEEYVKERLIMHIVNSQKRKDNCLYTVNKKKRRKTHTHSFLGLERTTEKTKGKGISLLN